MYARRPPSLLVLCGLLPLALAACGDSPAPDPRTGVPLVRTALVQEAGPAGRAFTGTVAARVQSDLGFRVPGKVLERLVDAGQTVKRGQPLMRIDASDLKLAERAQQDAVLAARARAHLAAVEEARSRGLRGSGAISGSAYDQAKAADEAAKAQLSAAEAQADVARNASRYAVLVADGDGVVVATLAEPGQVVNAGQPVVRLAHAGQREALIQLPETLRPALGSVGQAARFGKEEAPVAALLRQLADAADPLTRTFEARYVLEGALAKAPLGTTVTVRIAEGQAGRGGLQVPLAALFDNGKGPGVWVVQGKPSRVAWRPVALVQLDAESARVSGGLKPGEQIVALGAHLLREGVQVRVAGAGAQP